MAEEQNKPTMGYVSREIQITGERVAEMFHTSIRVSRFEKSLIQMALVGNNQVRNLMREASDRYYRAVAAFHAELKEAERMIEAAKRPGNRPHRGTGTGQQPQLARPNSGKPTQEAAKKGQAPTSQAKGQEQRKPEATPAPAAAPAPATAAHVASAPSAESQTASSPAASTDGKNHKAAGQETGNAAKGQEPGKDRHNGQGQRGERTQQRGGQQHGGKAATPQAPATSDTKAQQPVAAEAPTL